MPVASGIKDIFAIQAYKKGYNVEQAKKYVADRADAYENSVREVSGIVAGSSVAVMAIIAHKSKGTTFKIAARKLFKPFIDAADKYQRFLYFDKNDNFVKCFEKGLEFLYKNSIGLAFDMTKGFCKSIPKFIGVPALILLGLNTLKYNNKICEINARHDTIKQLNDNNDESVTSEE